jgi:hypothetical protein
MSENPIHALMSAFSIVAPTDMMANARSYRPELGSLFLHLVAAEAVEFHLRRSIESAGGPRKNPSTVAEIGEELSAFRVISVYYAMIFVVLEGYLELKLSDTRVDSLIKDTAKVDTLRRFRNATFHYQSNPLSPKLMDHLDQDRQGEWTRALAKALTSYLVSELGIEKLVE